MREAGDTSTLGSEGGQPHPDGPRTLLRCPEGWRSPAVPQPALVLVSSHVPQHPRCPPAHGSPQPCTPDPAAGTSLGPVPPSGRMPSSLLV